jgi:hypothetical protein
MDDVHSLHTACTGEVCTTKCTTVSVMTMTVHLYITRFFGLVHSHHADILTIQNDYPWSVYQYLLIQLIEIRFNAFWLPLLLVEWTKMNKIQGKSTSWLIYW